MKTQVLMQLHSMLYREEFKRSYDDSILLADVGRNVILTSGCIIGACCRLNTCEEIPENTVIYSSNCMRRVQTERPQVTHTITQQGISIVLQPETLLAVK